MSQRRNERHRQRWTQSLDQLWDFSFLGDVTASSLNISDIHFDDLQPVPGCFDVCMRYANARGVGAYRTMLDIAQVGRYRVAFESILHHSHIYLDGKLLGELAFGFSPINIEFNVTSPGQHELVVLADNRFDNEHTPLHQPFYDWLQHGGINRSVELQRLPDSTIEQMHFATVDYATRKVKLTLTTHAQTPCTAPLEVKFNEAFVLEQSISLNQGQQSHTFELTLPSDVGLWSPDSPHLHLLEVQLGEDDWRQRVGIRQVQTQGHAILLNGEPFRLMGVNRHEMHPDTGAAITLDVQLHDARLIKDMGANFVRGSHYPPDPVFLDLCDELGLCFWAETLGWGVRDEHMGNLAFLDAAQAQGDLMVDTCSSHPSVIFWGALNECYSNTKVGRAAVERLLGRLRELDPSRLITFASDKARTDLCFDLVDVISLNLYPGWYQGDLDGMSDWLNDLLSWLDTQPAAANKPTMITEIGAGAIPGWRDRFKARWSEQYQAALLSNVLDFMDAHPSRMAGLCVWQYCDIRVSSDVPMILNRPRGFNNKGVVNEYRQPKMAYDVLSSRFREMCVAPNSK